VRAGDFLAEGMTGKFDVTIAKDAGHFQKFFACGWLAMRLSPSRSGTSGSRRSFEFKCFGHRLVNRGSARRLCCLHSPPIISPSVALFQSPHSG
jgi:hypothetical protein